LADLLIYRTEKSGWSTALNWSRVDRVSVRLFPGGYHQPYFTFSLLSDIIKSEKVR